MKTNKKLEDVVLAIERWRDDCDERGEEPVCIANFASTGSDGVDENATGVVIGEQENVEHLLAHMVEIISPSAPC